MGFEESSEDKRVLLNSGDNLLSRPRYIDRDLVGNCSDGEWYLPLISYSPGSCQHSDVIAARACNEMRWPGKCFIAISFLFKEIS